MILSIFNTSLNVKEGRYKTVTRILMGSDSKLIISPQISLQSARKIADTVKVIAIMNGGSATSVIFRCLDSAPYFKIIY